MIQKLKALFKMARLQKSDDKPSLRNGWFFYQGKEIKGTLFTPYGFMHNPPDGSIVMLFSQNGQESNAIGIADDCRNRIFKENSIGDENEQELQPGEVAIGNYGTRGYIKFDNEKDTREYIPRDHILKCDRRIEWNVEESFIIHIGSMTLTIDQTGLHITGGDIAAQDGGPSIKLTKHYHNDPDDGNITAGPIGNV